MSGQPKAPDAVPDVLDDDDLIDIPDAALPPMPGQETPVPPPTLRAPPSLPSLPAMPQTKGPTLPLRSAGPPPRTPEQKKADEELRARQAEEEIARLRQADHAAPASTPAAKPEPASKSAPAVKQQPRPPSADAVAAKSTKATGLPITASVAAERPRPAGSAAPLPGSAAAAAPTTTTPVPNPPAAAAPTPLPSAAGPATSAAGAALATSTSGPLPALPTMPTPLAPTPGALGSAKATGPAAPLPALPSMPAPIAPAPSAADSAPAPLPALPSTPAPLAPPPSSPAAQSAPSASVASTNAPVSQALLGDVGPLVDETMHPETMSALAPALPLAEDTLPGATESAAGKELALSLVDVAKAYYKGSLEVPVLDGLDLEIAEGAFVALMGPSGSGKSTLLHLIAGLDRPTAGSIRVAGADLGSMSEEQLSRWRARTIGFIFQHYNLLPALTAAQNVELPLLLRRELSKAERRERVRIALKVVGLEDRMEHKPRELSGGQEQRVAIARAIVSDPKILICDEPTGDLDRAAADAVLDLLVRLNHDFDKTIFMVTHDPAAAARASSKRLLSKGKLA